MLQSPNSTELDIVCKSLLRLQPICNIRLKIKQLKGWDHPVCLNIVGSELKLRSCLKSSSVIHDVRTIAAVIRTT